MSAGPHMSDATAVAAAMASVPVVPVSQQKAGNLMISQATDIEGGVAAPLGRPAPAPSIELPSTVDTLLAGAHNLARQSSENLADLVEALPGDVPLWVAIDVAAARAHLIAAQRLIDTTATCISSVRQAAAAVTA